MRIKVSILIPAFNAEKWIFNTLKSAIEQTWDDTEIIVIDDGSTDKTYEIANKFASEKLKVVRTDNLGACHARNLAFSLSQGDYIQWLDADDLLSPTKIQKQVEFVLNNPDPTILLSGTYFKFYNRIRDEKYPQNLLYKDMKPIDWLITHLENEAIMYPHAWLVSRHLTINAGPWNENLKINQDGEYFARVVSKSSFVKYIPSAICYYRMGNISSISNKRTIDKIKSLSNANNLCVDHLLSLENSERTKRACIRFLQRFVSRIYLDDNSEIIVFNNNRIRSLGGEKISKNMSNKMKILSFFIGLKLSSKVKLYLWHYEILFKAFLDKIIATISNKRI